VATTICITYRRVKSFVRCAIARYLQPWRGLGSLGEEELLSESDGRMDGELGGVGAGVDDDDCDCERGELDRETLYTMHTMRCSSFYNVVYCNLSFNRRDQEMDRTLDFDFFMGSLPRRWSSFLLTNKSVSCYYRY